jgi:dihydrodipicolinate synthase/N-acetylneuraminate lyase
MSGTRDGAQRIHGVIPILPTPFNERGEVDEYDFIRAVDASMADGVHGLAMFGLASEAYKLSDEEKKRLTTLLIEHVVRRIPVIISVIHHATEIAVREAAWAEAAGADAIMVMPPYLMPVAETAVRSHITRVADAVGIPVIVQYAPLQTGTSLSPESLAGIHREHPNVTHVKVDAVPSGPMITRLHDDSQNSLQTLVGYMGLHLPDDMRRGVRGVMPTVSLGRVFGRIYELLHEGNKEGHQLHNKVLPLLNFMMQSIEMLIAVEKELLVRRGILRNAMCRHPKWNMDQYHRAELELYATELSEWLPIGRQVN